MCANPKYRIKKLLLDMPGEYRVNLYLLCATVNVSVKTLENWIKTERDAKFSISSDKFYTMADFFGVKPTDLING